MPPKICSECRYWEYSSFGVMVCDFIQEDDLNYPHHNGETAGIVVHVLDDSDLSVRLRTTANFGCTNFKQLDQ